MSEYAGGYRKWPHDDHETVQTKQKYRSLKRKMRCLLYEQECFQEELRRLQRKLLRVNRDKSFLLDRLLQYEPAEFSSSDEEETASSAEEGQQYNSYWNSNNFGSQQTSLPTKKGTDSARSTVNHGQQEAKTQPKTKKTSDNVERVRCRQIENGKRCPKMVSRRVKVGLCLAHRGGDSKSGKPASQQNMQSIVRPRPEVDFFSQPNPMISGISSEHAQQAASASINDEMYSMTDIHQDSGTADSPASSDFNSNIYEGDDDLVIDLPE